MQPNYFVEALMKVREKYTETLATDEFFSSLIKVEFPLSKIILFLVLSEN